MNIVILGGLGYIGAHLAKRLMGEGHIVTIVDRKEAPLIEALLNIAPQLNIRADLDECSPKVLAVHIQKNVFQNDLVIHLADEKDICEIQDRAVKEYLGEVDVPKEDILNNVVRNPQVRAAFALRLASALGARRLIYASSGAVYESLLRAPVSEGAIANGSQSAYAGYKVKAEKVLEEFHADLGVDVTILRYGNPIGCKYGFTYGLFGDATSLGGKITRFVSGYDKRFELDEYIKDHPDPLRSFIDINRLCIATSKVIGNQVPAANSYEIYNVGGLCASPRQILNAFFNHNGVTMNPSKIVPRKLEHFRHGYNVLNSTKFETAYRMSLQPSLGELVEGIR